MIGEHIRTLRESRNILLRQLAPKLDIDPAMLSKMERGDRFFRKEDIEKLSKIFQRPREELLVLWVADKLIKIAKSEKYGKEALKIAINNV